jgi:hypothetical protein
MRNKSIMLLDVSLVLLTSIFGCGGGGGGDSTPPPSPPPYIGAWLLSFPTGSVPPTNFANALVSVETDSSSGANITTANVIMNGVTLTYNASPTHQQYEGNVTVMPGGSVTLSVTVGGNTYSVSGTQFSSYPTISEPVSGATWTASSANTVTWSAGAPLTNAAYLLGVLDATDPDGDTPYFQATQTGLTSVSIPTNSLVAGNRVLIVGIVTVLDIPNAATNSALVLGGFDYVPITIIN